MNDTSNNALKEVAAAISFIIAVAVLILGFGYLSFRIYSFYAPKYVGVQNKVFHQSQIYTDGAVNQLEQYQIEYAGASAAKRAAIRSVVQEQFASFPAGRLNPNLRHFLNSMLGGTQP